MEDFAWLVAIGGVLVAVQANMVLLDLMEILVNAEHTGVDAPSPPAKSQPHESPPAERRRRRRGKMR